MSRKKRVTRPRANRGALTLVAVLLAASGLIRLGAGSGEAIAREVAHLNGGSEKAASAEGAVCETEADVATALASLEEREARVASEEQRVEERLALLAEAEVEMEQTMTELVAAEDELAATMAMAETAAEDDLTRLTAVYEAMKPKDAAALFERMAPEFAAGFLGRMSAAAAAEVMTGLKPDTAYTISVVMAGRNAKAPTE